MAIFGFGATYDREDVSARFVAAGVACVGWSETDAPPLHNILHHIKIGDIAFLKSFAPQIGLTIKAVGIVTGRKPRKIFAEPWPRFGPRINRTRMQSDFWRNTEPT